MLGKHPRSSAHILHFQGWFCSLSKPPLGVSTTLSQGPKCTVSDQKGKLNTQPTNRDIKAISNAYPIFLPISAFLRIAATHKIVASNHITALGHQISKQEVAK